MKTCKKVVPKIRVLDYVVATLDMLVAAKAALKTIKTIVFG
jgi:hypothetical protein